MSYFDPLFDPIQGEYSTKDDLDVMYIPKKPKLGKPKTNLSLIVISIIIFFPLGFYFLNLSQEVKKHYEQGNYTKSWDTSKKLERQLKRFYTIFLSLAFLVISILLLKQIVFFATENIESPTPKATLQNFGFIRPF